MEARILELMKETQVWELGDLEGDVVVSLLRGFSAPVKLVSKVWRKTIDTERLRRIKTNS